MSRDVNLGRPLILETKSGAADGAGGFENNWVEMGTMWADFTGERGRGRETSLNDTSVVTSKIIVRSAQVGSSMRPHSGQRFREGSRIYMIEAVNEYDTQGLYLACWVKEEFAI
jgi:head-tail adaptor